MKPTRSTPLFRLISTLVHEFALMLVPIVLAAVLPWPVGVGLVVVIFAAAWLGVGMKRVKAAFWLSHVLTGLIIGLSIGLLVQLPVYWNVVAGPLLFLVGLGAQGVWERRRGLMVDDPQSSVVHARGASAWGGGFPSQTPEGESIRVLDVGEIAMGGPVTCDYLFPDGVFLGGMGSSACFSDDGRYFAAPIPSRQAWGLAVLDRHERRLYLSKFSSFWELDAFTGGTLRGRHSPITSDQSTTVPLADVLRDAEALDLVPIQDLWLTPGWLEHNKPTEREFPPPPAGAHHVTATQYLPASLRDLPYPLRPLRYPTYEIAIDGQPSGLLVGDDASIVWRPDGRALCCRAAPRPDAKPTNGAKPTHGAHWVWSDGAGWLSLPHPWTWSGAEPSVTCDEPVALDEFTVRVAARFDYLGLSQGHHGVRLDHVAGDAAIVARHTPDGRMVTGTSRCTELLLALPLDSQGGRGAAMVETQPLLNGERARLRWLFDRDNEQGVHDCHIGDWELPGQWLLDHRASDCGRYLALVPAPGENGVIGGVVVVDVPRRALIRSDPMLVVRLRDFRDGQLELAIIAGRQDKGVPRTALCRFQEAAPSPDKAAAFTADRPGSDLVYQTVRLRVRDGDLAPVPDWRQVDQPQLAVADGDFVYPAPGGGDAAWLFGTATEFDDNWLRENAPRRNGYLLTASGCALGGLAPGMIWSTDGRYLALTRLLSEHDAHGRRTWLLQVLEPEAGRLYSMADPLGCMPKFESFDADGLRLLTHQHDWLVDGDKAESRCLSLETLLALPCTSLVRHDSWQLAPDQEANWALWRALDRTPLREWVMCG